MLLKLEIFSIESKIKYNSYSSDSNILLILTKLLYLFKLNSILKISSFSNVPDPFEWFII